MINVHSGNDRSNQLKSFHRKIFIYRYRDIELLVAHKMLVLKNSEPHLRFKIGSAVMPITIEPVIRNQKFFKIWRSKGKRLIGDKIS